MGQTISFWILKNIVTCQNKSKLQVKEIISISSIMDSGKIFLKFIINKYKYIFYGTKYILLTILMIQWDYSLCNVW